MYGFEVFVRVEFVLKNTNCLIAEIKSIKMHLLKNYLFLYFFAKDLFCGFLLDMPLVEFSHFAVCSCLYKMLHYPKKKKNCVHSFEKKGSNQIQICTGNIAIGESYFGNDNIPISQLTYNISRVTLHKAI